MDVVLRLDVFLAAFADMGVRAEESLNPKWQMPASAICFHGQAANEILIGGRKVAGNAQRVTRAGIFQHGSILLRNNEALFCELVPGAEAEGSMTGLLEHAPDVTPERLARAVVHHVARVFDLDPEPGVG